MKDEGKNKIKMNNMLIKTQVFLLMSDPTWSLFLGTSLLVTSKASWRAELGIYMPQFKT